MDCKRIKVLVLAPVEVPRGAEWAASVVVWTLHKALPDAHLLRRSAEAFGKGDPDNSRDDSSLRRVVWPNAPQAESRNHRQGIAAP